jgi:surfeit locus 1 family protein
LTDPPAPPGAPASRQGPLARPLLSLLFLLALGLLVSLGVWQLQRLAWKEDLLARIAAAERAPGAELSGVLEAVREGKDVEFTRVVTDCPGLDQAPYLKLYALQDRVTGFRAVSLCRVEDAPYPAILVDRGFVQDADAARLTSGGRSPEHRAVVGVLRSPEPPNRFTPQNRDGVWYSRDARAMAAALGGGEVAPVFLMLESPPPQGFGPRPAAVPRQISNNHLGYAITWFGLAAALAGVYLALLLRRPRS